MKKKPEMSMKEVKRLFYRYITDKHPSNNKKDHFYNALSTVLLKGRLIHNSNLSLLQMLRSGHFKRTGEILQILPK